MRILCSISAIKELPRTIKNITGGVSIWFFKPFLMYPLSLQELRSDNTAYLDLFAIFNLLWSIQLHVLKRSRELSKLQCL